MAQEFWNSWQKRGFMAACTALMVGCGGGGDGATAATTTTTSTTDTTSTTGTTGTQTGAGTTATSATGAASAASDAGATEQAIRKPIAPVLNGSRSGVGMNLGSFSYGSSEVATIDLMKRADPWLTQCYSWTSASCKDFTAGASGWDTLEESKLDLDANGWPRTLPVASDPNVKYRVVTTALANPGTLPAGKYVVLYDGEGTMTYSAGGKGYTVVSSPGRDIVDIPSPDTGGLLLTITATNPANYLRNVRVYMPGGACSNDYTTYAASAAACTAATGAYVPFERFPATVQWLPQLMQDLKGFRALRFMDWSQTNTSTVTDWTQRHKKTDRTWAWPLGVPLESMIDLANQVGADPWVNLPYKASDDYVRQYAQLLHNTLDSKRIVYVEYANEPWNYGFPATGWMLEQAKTAWTAAEAGTADIYERQLNWYGRRLAQVCQIVKTEFGSDAARVKCVANAQAGNTWGITRVLDCPLAAKQLGKACAAFIDAVAIAPYFGQYVSDAKYRSTIDTWYADADGGLGKLFEELMGQNDAGVTVTPPLAGLASGAPNGAQALARMGMAATKATLRTYGLPMLAYEGGQHLVQPMGDSDARMLKLFTDANHSARMGDAYLRSFADWQSSGGELFMYYSHMGTDSRYGMWGLKTSMTDTASPKWKAVVQVRDAARCWWSGC